MYDWTNKIVSLLVLALLIGCEQPSQQTPEQPNILYILADDLGYGEVGAYGQEIIETPNIDRLAENGILFTQHYSGSAVCAPTRAILMSGKHSGHAYIRANSARPGRDVWDFESLRENPEQEGNYPIPDSTVTVGEVLQSAGYRTAIVGKWGLGGPGTEGLPNDQGFDLFYGYLDQAFAHTYYPVHLWKNKERVYLDNEPVHPHIGRYTDLASLDPEDPATYARFHNQPDYSEALMRDEMISFIEDSQQTPFFLYYASLIPHVSLQAPERWVDYYREKLGEEEPYLGDEGYAPTRYPRATYAAMISYLDEQVGALITALKETGQYENTLIIFSSDNGPSYNGGADPAFFNSGGPFNETHGWGKGNLHEGGIRVPMIASWPGVIDPGGETDHLSAQWDVLPTLSEIAGVDAPDHIDGISFVPVLTGNEARQRRHEHLYWEYPPSGGQQAVRMGKWKGIRKNIVRDGNLEIELYNLEEDIREEQNIADEHPEIVEEIERIMEEEHTPPARDLFRMEALEKGER